MSHLTESAILELRDGVPVDADVRAHLGECEMCRTALKRRRHARPTSRRRSPTSMSGSTWNRRAKPCGLGSRSVKQRLGRVASRGCVRPSGRSEGRDVPTPGHRRTVSPSGFAATRIYHRSRASGTRTEGAGACGVGRAGRHAHDRRGPSGGGRAPPGALRHLDRGTVGHGAGGDSAWRTGKLLHVSPGPCAGDDHRWAGHNRVSGVDLRGIIGGKRTYVSSTLGRR